jgi:hypothetical protein
VAKVTASIERPSAVQLFQSQVFLPTVIITIQQDSMIALLVTALEIGLQDVPSGHDMPQYYGLWRDLELGSS